MTREEIRRRNTQATTQAHQTTSESEVEKKMIEWHDKLFAHQVDVVNKMNPTTAFMVGMMANGGNFLQIAGLTANRLMGDMGPYEFIVKITKTCYDSEAEYEALEGIVKLFHGLIDLGVCDSKITSTKEELEVVLKNI